MLESYPPPAITKIRHWQRYLIVAICALLLILGVYRAANQKAVIGATADVTESQSGITLKARVDTGASVSSLHCNDIVIESPEDEPEMNSGKKVRFLLRGVEGEQSWVESTILGYVGVRNASGTTDRYRVRLTLTCQGITKDTIVTLNDRSELKYPLLLGREFLEGDFVVDVSMDDPDYP